MPQRVEVVLARAIATRTVQDSIKNQWTWQSKTLAQWEADIAALQSQQAMAVEKERAEEGVRGDVNANFDALHNMNRIGVAAGKAHFIDTPAQRARFDDLTARQQSRAVILEEARRLEAAWEQNDASWNPTTTLTIIALRDQLAECEAFLSTNEKAQADRRAAAAHLRHLADELEDDCIRWYAAATAIFPEGTEAGRLIRGTIPTTTPSPSTASSPPSPPADPPSG
jgi:hypothetical protein